MPQKNINRRQRVFQKYYLCIVTILPSTGQSSHHYIRDMLSFQGGFSQNHWSPLYSPLQYDPDIVIRFIESLSTATELMRILEVQPATDTLIATAHNSMCLCYT